VRRRTVLGCFIGDGGGRNEGLIALRIEAVDGRGIARGRVDETAAFEADVVVVLIFVFGTELSQLALLALTQAETRRGMDNSIGIEDVAIVGGFVEGRRGGREVHFG
jgi:hypothetical protein